MNKLPYILSLLVLLSTVFGSEPARAQWSPQAKGAVIGGLGGAAAGALINKRNRAVGGIVGGVAGGAIGYGIGKHIDNKRKERARIAAANRAAAYREEQYRNSLRRSEAHHETVVTTRTQTTAVPMNSLTATNASLAPGLQANAQPAASNAAYLPNDSYGDSSKPYAESEYRRKSW
ncbi:MAG: hypothetical protein NVS3B25_09170 [Hymenobacter sp.]